ncbi:response regulator [Candidatus Dependentiae bacterium]|nr:response regulator [Candidatus Dependentiae bacterium]
MTEQKPFLLVIDDEITILKTLKEALEDEGYRVQTLQNGNCALDKIGELLPDLVLLDIFMPNCNGIDLLEKIKKEYPQQKVIMISGFGNIPIAIESTKKGALDFIEKPLNLDEILSKLSFLKKNNENPNKVLKKDEIEDLKEYGIVGQSYLFLELIQQIKQVAFLPFPLLIYGQHGSGKTTFIKFIQKLNKFDDSQFFLINGTNICEQEVCREMEAALSNENGILFLKNVEKMSFYLQKYFDYKLEKRSCIKTRIVASASCSLFELMQQGKFSKSLFLKLNITPIEIPPLNKRRYDIPLLVDYFLNKYNKKYKKNILFNNQSIRFMRNYNWFGNVEQLEATINKIVRVTTDQIEIISPQVLSQFIPENKLQIIEEQSFLSFNSLDEAKDEFEKQFLIYQIKKNHYDIKQVSNKLNLTKLQLQDKMLKFKIDCKN